MYILPVGTKGYIFPFFVCAECTGGGTAPFYFRVRAGTSTRGDIPLTRLRNKIFDDLHLRQI